IKALIQGDIEIPGRIALIAAIVSIVLKEGLYWNTIRAARKIKSISLEADAWHHRSDALSSIGTFAGILGARLGARVLDPLAGVVVSVLIIKVGVEFWLKASKGLVDVAAPPRTVDEIKKIAMDVEGVKGINT